MKSANLEGETELLSAQKHDGVASGAGDGAEDMEANRQADYLPEAPRERHKVMHKARVWRWQLKKNAKKQGRAPNKTQRCHTDNDGTPQSSSSRPSKVRAVALHHGCHQGRASWATLNIRAVDETIARASNRRKKGENFR
jgi:hypothetical protein